MFSQISNFLHDLFPVRFSQTSNFLRDLFPVRMLVDSSFLRNLFPPCSFQIINFFRKLFTSGVISPRVNAWLDLGGGENFERKVPLFYPYRPIIELQMKLWYEFLEGYS